MAIRAVSRNAERRTWGKKRSDVDGINQKRRAVSDPKTATVIAARDVDGDVCKSFSAVRRAAAL